MPARATRTALAVTLSAGLLSAPVAVLLWLLAGLTDLATSLAVTPAPAREAGTVLLGLAAAGLAVVLLWTVAAVAAGLREAWTGRGAGASRPDFRCSSEGPGRLVRLAVAGLVVTALGAPVAVAAERPAVGAPAHAAATPAPPDLTSPPDVGAPAPPDGAAGVEPDGQVGAGPAVPGSWSGLAGTPFRAPRTVGPASAALVTGSASRRPAEDRAQVAVVAGDSLWSLVRDHLGPDVPDAEVAAVWPTWWQANRTTIGDDPDLLLPGQLLTVPAVPVEEKP